MKFKIMGSLAMAMLLAEHFHFGALDIACFVVSIVLILFSEIDYERQFKSINKKLDDLNLLAHEIKSMQQRIEKSMYN